MPLPPDYFPVYHRHIRLVDIGPHANPLVGTPPVPHVEGLHTIQWLMSDPEKLTKTVQGDGCQFALRNHDSGKFIPHLPLLPPMVGPFLLDTHLGSKYQVIFHQPHVLMDGAAAGIFFWGVAPPWFCSELRLPIPKFLAQGGRAAARRKRAREMEKLAEAHRDASLLEKADKAAAIMDAIDRFDHQERLLEMDPLIDEQIRQSRAAERAARERKTELERFARRGNAAAAQHEREAREQLARAQRAQGKEHADALAAAARHREQADKARSGAEACAREAKEHEAEAKAHRRTGKMSREIRRQEEARRIETAKAKGKKAPKENPRKEATGMGNTGMALPSLLAHVPLPSTVQLRVSWEQILETWCAAAVNLVREVLVGYVGFLFDGILAPGRSKGVAWVLDLVKSMVSDGMLGAAQKFIVEDKLSVKLQKKLGPVTVGVEYDHTSNRWKVETKSAGKFGSGLKFESEGPLLGAPEKVSVKLGERKVFERKAGEPPVIYGHGIPGMD